MMTGPCVRRGLCAMARRLPTACILAMIVMASTAPQAEAMDWTQQYQFSRPSGRWHAAMASVSGDQVLLFGGDDAGGRDDETWVYDPSDDSWTLKSPPVSPSARYLHAMASIGGDQVLLFGGYDAGGCDDETWVYDLSEDSWTQLSPGAKPSARRSHAMASLEGDRVLLFGGTDGGDETWVYDLSENTWTQMVPDPKPSARESHAMASIDGDQVLLFGGGYEPFDFDDETWVYDLSENTWIQLSPDPKPSARESHAMASLGGDQVLLFGGWTGDPSYDDETWVYDLSENTWTQMGPDPKPSERFGHAMASLGGGQVLLFGGQDLGGPDWDDETWVYRRGITVTPTSGLMTTEGGGTASFGVYAESAPTADVTIPLSSSDTTEGMVPASVVLPAGSTAPVTVIVTGVDDAILDGNVGYTILTGDPTSADAAYDAFGAEDLADVTVANQDDEVGTWIQMNPAANPSARHNHAMASLGEDQVLLFGGFVDWSRDDETWVYDRSENTWTQISPAVSPSARQSHAMASLDGEQVLLFGGYDGSVDDETWVYDLSENTWTQMSPAVSPSARGSHAMASLGGDQVLLFGGDDGSVDDETWVYDLSEDSWTQISPAVKPPARVGHAMANVGGNQVLLFGGGHDPFDDETWVYDLSEGIWMQMSPDVKPVACFGHAMANVGGDQVLLFGGFDCWFDLRDETWVYDLSEDNWTQMSPGAKPSGRQLPEMASISGDQVLLFGGADVGGLAFDDTWVYRRWITVTLMSGLVTTEAGGTAAFDVTAEPAPTADVMIPLSSSDTSEGAVPAFVVLPAGSTAPVTVTVTGVDDAILDGDVGYTIVTGDPTSADVAYDALGAEDVADVTVTNQDDELPGTDTAAIFRVTDVGDVLADGTFSATVFETGSADVAEWVSVTEPVEAGDVLALDPTTPGSYRRSQWANSSLVAGVVASAPGVVLGVDAAVGERALLALIGVVPVKATDEGGSIKPGDLLVSSSTHGCAMRWDGVGSPALIGKALEPLIGRSGMILVLLTAH